MWSVYVIPLFSSCKFARTTSPTPYRPVLAGRQIEQDNASSFSAISRYGQTSCAARHLHFIQTCRSLIAVANVVWFAGSASDSMEMSYAVNFLHSIEKAENWLAVCNRKLLLEEAVRLTRGLMRYLSAPVQLVSSFATCRQGVDASRALQGATAVVFTEFDRA